MDSLRIGIIGIGFYSTVAHVPQLRGTGRAEVVAIARRSADKLAFSQQQLGVEGAYTDWRELLQHPGLDAVVISTPHHLHAEQGMAALDQGLHLLMEKPLALTLHDAIALVNRAEQANRVLMVGYNRRFHGLWRALHTLLRSNGIGEIRQINLQMAFYRRHYWEGTPLPEVRAMIRKLTSWPDEYFDEWEAGKDWHASAESSGGGMFSNSGSHFVDLILWLAGSYPTDVMAFSEAAGMPAECFLAINARLANGVQVSITTADVEPGGFAGQGSLTIVGEKGIVSYDLSKPTEIWLSNGVTREPIATNLVDTNAAAAFVATILDGDENFASAREGAYAVAFTEAVYQSAAEKRIITPNYGALLKKPITD